MAALTLAELHARIADHIRHKRHALVLHVNAHGLNLAYKQRWLRDFLHTAATVFCDGVGVVLGARLLGYRIPHRITYADWMWQLAEFAQSRDFSFFFLGARPGIAEKAAERLRECFPSLHIVGMHHGYFDKTAGNAENGAVLQVINAASPSILIVAFGMPEQERWLMENWDCVNADVALTGGAVFDYISGELRRGPRWMTDNGFEWLARMLIEPKRLWRRYLFGNPLFLWRVLKQRLGWLRFD
ncbi:MAG TPA: WecB/TagA/CpsF family glycosyltransferase [Anaerolineae bacterium]|nr:WecB/TagA/CpsF family glycosyltransferase [Anaerolineae bacterium]